MTAARQLVKRCPSLEVKLAAGVVARLQFSRATTRNLLRGSIALHEVIARTVGGRKYTSNALLGIYQASGRILSVVAASGENVVGTRTLVAHAAQESALNLR